MRYVCHEEFTEKVDPSLFRYDVVLMRSYLDWLTTESENRARSVGSEGQTDENLVRLRQSAS